MQSPHSSNRNGRPSAVETSKLDELRAKCRRQAQAIDVLSDAVRGLRRGARALNVKAG